ncbi:MAG: AAC(3) family N-acetyltransferase [Candidatus Latescibacterota bacterium]
MNAAEAEARLAQELRSAGVRPGGVCLVHSSLSSLGTVPGGAETVVRGLLAALGSEGTLLMPGLSYRHVHAGQPRFEVLATPSNVGAIPEHFRQRPGTRRSLHPTHSVCGIGPLAAELLAGHQHDRTPCGPRSPFRLLPQVGGQLLMLGCGLKPNTSMHGVEELVEPPYLFGGVTTFELVDELGVVMRREYRCHGFQGWGQHYERVAGMLRPEEARQGTVLQAEVWVLEARAVWQAGEAALRRDPLCLVHRVP